MSRINYEAMFRHKRREANLSPDALVRIHDAVFAPITWESHAQLMGLMRELSKNATFRECQEFDDAPAPFVMARDDPVPERLPFGWSPYRKVGKSCGVSKATAKATFVTAPMREVKAEKVQLKVARGAGRDSSGSEQQERRDSGVEVEAEAEKRIGGNWWKALLSRRFW